MRWCAASIEGVEGIIGPTIIPGETPCYMCYKMQTAATREKSYSDAMAYYEYLDNTNSPGENSEEPHSSHLHANATCVTWPGTLYIGVCTCYIMNIARPVNS